LLDDFKTFLFRGNVIDLAVAVIIGAAFTGIVTAISTGILTPLIGMIFSKDFSEMYVTLNGSRFRYGLVIDAVISFVLVAGVIFFVVVKPMQLLAERRARGEATDATPAPSDEAVLLTEIQDLLAARPER
jgi:large conductance mechanosensitive channel